MDHIQNKIQELLVDESVNDVEAMGTYGNLQDALSFSSRAFHMIRTC